MIVLPNQSLLDVAIQHTGSVLNTFAIAFENKISITEKLENGVELNKSSSVVEVREIVNLFKTRQNIPASDFNMEIIEVKPSGGVGYWEIENEFEVL